MFKKREMAETIARQGESIIALHNRITKLNQKIINQQKVISEQIEEETVIYADLKETRIEKEEAEIRATEFARKLKKIEDIVKGFNEEDKINKQVAINFYTKLKNVLAKSDQTNN